jgi:hypothetical protein
MRKDIVRPNTLKGKEKHNRMLELMGESTIKDEKNYVIELTKKGPDGKVYAIVRENHQYFIKVTDKKENIIAEDFKYMGGLQNKTEMAFPSYAKAIKQLNLKFINLKEAYNSNENIDTFSDDNLITEENALGVAAQGFSETTVFEDEESLKETEDMEGVDAKEDKETSGDNLDGGFVEKAGGSENVTEELDPVGKEDDDVDNDGEENDPNDLYIKNKRMKISKAIEECDEDLKKKV